MTELYGRRLQSELELLHALAAGNPGRITDVTLHSDTLRLRLHGPAAMRYGTVPPCPIPVHAVRIHFPVHFPAVPMEMFLSQAAVHPNIHPDTGFVCLWDRHRVSNTVEHAMHKLVAMLAGQLHNAAPQHVMQPGAVNTAGPGSARPLLGVLYDGVPLTGGTARRRRLQ